MSITVISQGQEFSFPDGTSTDVISNAINGHFGITPEQQAMNREKALLAQETPAWKSSLIGAGQAFTRLGQGARDILAQVTGNEALQQNIAKQVAEEQRHYQPLQQQRPLSTAIGEATPYMAGEAVAGAGLRGAGLIANLAGQSATGAALGGTTYAPTTEKRMTNAMVEGATGFLGEGASRILSRMIGGLGIPADVATVRSANKSQNMGYEVLPSTRVNSPILANVVEGGLESTPGGALKMDRLAANNQSLLNRQAAKAIGESADAPTDEVVNNAFNRIGEEFNRVMSDNINVPVDEELLDAVIRIDEDRITPMLVGAEDPVRGLVNRTMDLLERGLQKGGLTAKEIQAHQSKLGKAAWAQRYNNPELSMALGELQEELLNAAGRNMSGADREALKAAKNQYRNLKTVSTGNNFNPVTGDINASNVANYLSRKDPRGWMRGQNKSDFYEGVRFMAKAQPPKKSSGTAERTAMREILKMGGIGAGIGAGGSTAGGDFNAGTTLGGGLLSILGTIAAPNLAARAYLTPMAKNYMTRQMPVLGQQLMRAGSMGTAQTGSSLLDQIRNR